MASNQELLDLFDPLVTGHSTSQAIGRSNEETKYRPQEPPWEGQGDKEQIVNLQREVEQLKQACADLVEVNRYRVRNEPKPWLKPRDIPILELGQLKGVEGEGKLSTFLSQIEQCSHLPEERKRILATRLDSHLGILVQAMVSEDPYMSWGELKEALKENLTDQSKDRLLDSLSEMKYDVMEDPYEFTSRLKCRLALLDVNSGRVDILKKNKIIKQKLIQGLPRTSREKLELYKEADIPLTQFLNKFMNMRALVIEQGDAPVRVVTTNPPAKSKEVDERLERLEATVRKWNFSGGRWERSRTPKYCPYCKSTAHNIRECKKKPRPGSCYDCLGMNCRRGNTNCPGPKEEAQ